MSGRAPQRQASFHMSLRENPRKKKTDSDIEESISKPAHPRAAPRRQRSSNKKRQSSAAAMDSGSDDSDFQIESSAEPSSPIAGPREGQKTLPKPGGRAKLVFRPGESRRRALNPSPSPPAHSDVTIPSPGGVSDTSSMQEALYLSHTEAFDVEVYTPASLMLNTHMSLVRSFAPVEDIEGEENNDPLSRYMLRRTEHDSVDTWDYHPATACLHEGYRVDPRIEPTAFLIARLQQEACRAGLTHWALLPNRYKPSMWVRKEDDGDRICLPYKPEWYDYESDESVEESESDEEMASDDDATITDPDMVSDNDEAAIDVDMLFNESANDTDAEATANGDANEIDDSDRQATRWLAVSRMGRASIVESIRRYWVFGHVTLFEQWDKMDEAVRGLVAEAYSKEPGEGDPPVPDHPGLRNKIASMLRSGELPVKPVPNWTPPGAAADGEVVLTYLPKPLKTYLREQGHM